MAPASSETGSPTPEGVANGPAVASQRAVQQLIQQIAEIPAPEEQTQPMAQEQFDADVVVIGAGPGGYVAAIRAAQMGAKTVCVEKEYLGGTCLNWGCIPSKAMIASVERLHHVNHAKDFGVVVNGDVSMDFDVMMKRKEKIVTTLRGGVGMLFKKNGVRHVEGFASFVDPHTIKVVKDGKEEKIRAKNFILAMGSSVIQIPIEGVQYGRDNDVWTSDEAVTAHKVPKSMLIVGGGAVGCEFAYVFNGLGSKITLCEMMPALIPLMDADLGAELKRVLSKQGIGVRTGATLQKAEKTAEGWKCTVQEGAKTEEIVVETILMGVGRKANVDGMNLESIGVQMHRRGVQVVDDTLRTHVPHIHAIGDVHGKIQLAHVASAEGIHIVQNVMRGEAKPFDYKAVPNAVYTVPEVASVGLTEGEAKEKGYDVTIGKFAFRPLGRAMASGEQDGFVKIVAEKKYGEVLGVHMIGPHVTDMIHEAVVALKLEATLDYMVDTIHAHPTMAEAVMEAFHDAAGHAIHKI